MHFTFYLSIILLCKFPLAKISNWLKLVVELCNLNNNFYIFRTKHCNGPNDCIEDGYPFVVGSQISKVITCQPCAEDILYDDDYKLPDEDRNENLPDFSFSESPKSPLKQIVNNGVSNAIALDSDESKNNALSISLNNALNFDSQEGSTVRIAPLGNNPLIKGTQGKKRNLN